MAETYAEKQAKALAKLDKLVQTKQEIELKKLKQSLKTFYDSKLKGYKAPKKELARRDWDLGNYVAYLIEARKAYEAGNTTKKNAELLKALATCEKLSEAQGNLELHKAEAMAKKSKTRDAIGTGVKRSLKSIFLAGVVGAAGLGIWKGAKAGINAISTADVDREAAKQPKITQVATTGGTIINNNQTSINVRQNSTSQNISQNSNGGGSGEYQRAHLSTPAPATDSDIGGADGGTMTYTQRLNQNVNSSMDQVKVPQSRGSFAAEYTARAQRNALSDLDVHGSDNAAHIANNMVVISDADRAIHNNDLQKNVDHFRAVEDSFECVEGMADSTREIVEDVADTTHEIHRTLEGFKNMFNFRP